MNRFAMIAAPLLVFVATGCVTQSNLLKRTLTKHSFDPELLRLPDLGVDAETEIGESIITTAKRTVYPGIELKQEVVHSGVNVDRHFILKIPKSTLVTYGFDATGVFYVADRDLDFAVGKSVFAVQGGVYVPHRAPSATEIFWLATDNRAVPLNDAHPGIAFDPTNVERWGAESFKRQLIYGGMSENTITIVYREFINDIARPAFTQELKYDLSKGLLIGYQKARFEVLSASNTSIKYRVLKHLD